MTHEMLKKSVCAAIDRRRKKMIKTAVMLMISSAAGFAAPEPQDAE